MPIRPAQDPGRLCLSTSLPLFKLLFPICRAGCPTTLIQSHPVPAFGLFQKFRRLLGAFFDMEKLNLRKSSDSLGKLLCRALGPARRPPHRDHPVLHVPVRRGYPTRTADPSENSTEEDSP